MQWDSEHGSSSRSSGFDRNPFDEFNDEIYKDKSRTYHQTFTSGSTRKRKGDNVVRDIMLDFTEAVKGTTIGTFLIIQVSHSKEKVRVLLVEGINASQALLLRDVFHVVVQVQQCIVEEAL